MPRLTDCGCCGGSGAVDFTLMDAHPECFKEMNRRRKSGICGLCGENNAEIDGICNTCGPDSTFQGFTRIDR